MVEPRVKTKVEKKIGETIRCSFPKRQGMKYRKFNTKAVACHDLSREVSCLSDDEKIVHLICYS